MERKRDGKGTSYWSREMRADLADCIKCELCLKGLLMILEEARLDHESE